MFLLFFLLSVMLFVVIMTPACYGWRERGLSTNLFYKKHYLMTSSLLIPKFDSDCKTIKFTKNKSKIAKTSEGIPLIDFDKLILMLP